MVMMMMMMMMMMGFRDAEIPRFRDPEIPRSRDPAIQRSRDLWIPRSRDPEIPRSRDPEISRSRDLETMKTNTKVIDPYLKIAHNENTRILIQIYHTHFGFPNLWISYEFQRSRHPEISRSRDQNKNLPFGAFALLFLNMCDSTAV